MNLYFRLIYVLILTYFRSRITSILEPTSLRLRVLPTDLDINGHMNNGRYPTLMDLGRLDLVIRSGLMRMMMKQKSVPVLGSIKIRFRIPLMPFQLYDMETRVLCWDDKWVYMEQRFIISKGRKAGAVAAIAIVKGGFYNQKSKTTVPTQEILDAIGIDDQSPEFPAHILEWQKAEESLREVTSEAA